MARVTVEDCIVKIPNRFKLVMLASQRARNVSAGAPLTIERDNDKNPVIALREIADETIDLENLEDNFVKSLQKHVEIDEPEEDELDFEAIQQELSGETIVVAAPTRDALEDIVDPESIVSTSDERDVDDTKTTSEEG